MGTQNLSASELKRNSPFFSAEGPASLRQCAADKRVRRGSALPKASPPKTSRHFREVEMTHEQSLRAADFTGGFRRDAQSPEQQAPPLQHAQTSLVMANVEGLGHLKHSTLPKISK